MRKLSLSEYASIAEIIAAAVIIVSLGYVGVQIDQNTRALQQGTYQNINEVLGQGDLLLASDPELDRIVALAESDDSQLTDRERSRFGRYAITRIAMWEYTFDSYQAGAFSERQFDSFANYFGHVICAPGYRRFWEDNKYVTGEDFQAFVQGIIGNCSQ